MLFYQKNPKKYEEEGRLVNNQISHSNRAEITNQFKRRVYVNIFKARCRIVIFKLIVYECNFVL